MHFILGEIYRQGGICPQIIKKGEKLYQVSIRRRKEHIANTIFRDTFNWIPLKLSKMPKALGLEVEDKGWFPHSYNRHENLFTQLPNLPPYDAYGAETMMEEGAFNFQHWYYANAIAKRTPFCLKDALEEYCMQDVAILAHAVVKFRQLFLDVTKKDIIHDSMTIAGFCLEYFIDKYMGEREIGVIPDNGYSKMDQQSGFALKYLKWIAFRDSLRIQHRDSLEGEKRVAPYKLDGYVRRQPRERDLCIEFNGKFTTKAKRKFTPATTCRLRVAWP